MIFRPLVLAGLFALGLVGPSAAQTEERQWFASGPVPSRYEIAITPDAEANTFAGDVRVTVRTTETLPAVTMNALGMTVSSATIDNVAAQASVNEEAQTLTLTPRRPLRAGQHTIHIAYTGHIQSDAYGLFRANYRGDDGQQHRMLVTQFEPSDARRLAPMWDQPNRRAVFSITVTAPSNEMAVSNMPVARSAPAGNGMTRTTFADTPAMASYLIFIGIGDFERITTTVDGTEIGVVVRRGAAERGRAALQAAAEVVHYYNDYFGIRYPLPKLDMIGAPGAGGFGAMENWGAILYFDQYLLLDSDRSSEADRQTVFGIVAHEIAHQWFGDLVTMNWWDDLWLNEGFASWMAAKATDALHPEWHPWLSELAGGTQGAMSLDSRAGSHPIVQTVNTIEQANLAFDDITYQKGLAVLRMMEAYVGEDGWRRGVHDYLTAHQYGNATTEDLWTAVQAASGQPVLEIAHSFTRQVGLPVLNVTGCANGAVSMTQRRFALDDAARTNERWSIPIVARQVGQQPVREVLPATETGSVNIGGCGTYLVNAGHSAYVRVHYDDANLARLTSQFASLDSADQLGLMTDYWTFARSGDASFGNYLDLAAAMPANADPIIVADTANSFTALAEYADGRPSQAAIRSYGVNVLRPYFDRVGWTPQAGEPANATQLRAGLIGALAELGDQQVIAEVRRRVQAAEGGDASALPASIRDAVMVAYANNATPEQYDALVAHARAATDFVEVRRSWLRVADVRDDALARRTLDMALTDEVPRQLRTQLIGRVTANHPRMGWDFLKAHRAQVEELLDPLSRGDYATNIAGANSDPAVADELEQYASNFPAGTRATVASAQSAIRLRAHTIATGMPQVEAWLAAHARPAPRGRRSSAH